MQNRMLSVAMEYAVAANFAGLTMKQRSSIPRLPLCILNLELWEMFLCPLL
jgi:hypothetical protein